MIGVGAVVDMEVERVRARPGQLPGPRDHLGGSADSSHAQQPRPGLPSAAARRWASPIEYARRYWYDTCVFDRRALRFLIDMIGADRLLIGTDFPAMLREQPAGRTLRSLGLPSDVVEDITWHNCFGFLGVAPPAVP